jgi:hypothetical protein
MHFPATEAGAVGTADVMSTAYAPTSAEACLMEEGAVIEDPAPQPAQPLNYMLVAAVGMGFGAAVTPVAENWYRRFSSKD